MYNKEYFTYTMSMPMSVAMIMSMPVSVAMTMCMTPLRYGGEREKKHSVHCHGPCCISSSSPMTICLRSQHSTVPSSTDLQILDVFFYILGSLSIK